MYMHVCVSLCVCMCAVWFIFPCLKKLLKSEHEYIFLIAKHNTAQRFSNASHHALW